MKEVVKKVDVITLGCSKNLVVSEFLIRQFEGNGILVSHDPVEPDGDVVIINTCGFIGDAKEESVETILDFIEARKSGRISRLYVMGCLSERYFEQLGKELPEVDRFYGKFDWQKIVEDIGKEYRMDLLAERTITTPKHYAYLKISEGCNRTCSYCAIPIITGKHQSKSIECLVKEATYLASQGVRELQLIAQDLSYYGLDLYKKSRLADLIEELSKIEGIKWIRLHYAYPAKFPFDVLKVMRENPKVCKYLDIALQHISDNVLDKMQRHVSKEETLQLVSKIRKEVPGIHLRTTLLVGHPGESSADHEELMQFVSEMRFERLGVFAYSHEEDTFAYKNYSDDIPQDIKEQRADEVMALQNEISAQLNAEKVGRSFRVIIDREEDGFYIGRTQYDSPEVDQEVLVSSDCIQLKIGGYYEVVITGAEDYDLFANLL